MVAFCRDDDARIEDAKRQRPPNGPCPGVHAEEEEERRPDAVSSCCFRKPLDSCEAGSTFRDDNAEEIVNYMLATGRVEGAEIGYAAKRKTPS